MSYKLYTDKNEIFECEIEVKNASTKNSFARIIIESKDTNLVFNGKIVGNKCSVPIQKLKGVLAENTSGKMYLEVIVEDTYFKPWESNFIVEEHTSVKVNVNEQKEVLTKNKPIVEIKGMEKRINLFAPMKEISGLCEQFGINKKNLKTKKKDFQQIVNEYFDSNSDYTKLRSEIIRGTVNFLK